MINISTQEELLHYLKHTSTFFDWEKAQVHYFTGGVSGTVAMVSEGSQSILVKQSMPELKVQASWACDPKRLRVENEALKVYAALLPDCTPSPSVMTRKTIS